MNIELNSTDVVKRIEKKALVDLLTENGFQDQVDEALRLYEDGLSFREIFSKLSPVDAQEADGAAQP